MCAQQNTASADAEQQHDERPLKVALVVDTSGNGGNGTSNSATQWAAELRRQGHEVRLVGIGAPEYPARENHIPLVSWISAKQQMQFAQPNRALFDRAFDGVDVVHIYEPFKFGRHALECAREHGLPVTAGFHVQPENVMYSAGPLRYVPGMNSFLYWLFRHWLYRDVDAIHVPTKLGAHLLEEHHYDEPIYVISNGYQPRFTAKRQRPGAEPAGVPFRIVASGRLANEKNHVELIEAISMSAHADDIHLTIAGTGPIRRRVMRKARKLLKRPATIGFHRNADMPDLLRSCDLLCHPSIADLESVSVIEGMACGLVPVIADSPLSAAGQFSLTPESSYPVGHPERLAERIDWWIDHPRELNEWGSTYADHTKGTYSVEQSVKRFVRMEREVIAAHRAGKRAAGDIDGR